MARALKGKDPKAAKPSRCKILIYGAPGVGKTWNALDFPSTYYMDAENGGNLPHYTDKLKASGGLYWGADDGANDFASVVEEFITLATTKHPYRTAVLDSYSKLLNTQISIDYQRMENAGYDMDKTFSREKKTGINLTRRMIRWIDMMDMNTILICHEKPVWEDSKQVGITFDGWDKLGHELHLILHITKQGASRKARVMKTRLEGFGDGDIFDWSYETFADRFGREGLEAESHAITPATEEQIARFYELMEVVNVPDKVRTKWDETTCEVSDMTEVDLQKRIDWLEGQLSSAASTTTKKGK
jgi:hypothetical protein